MKQNRYLIKFKECGWFKDEERVVVMAYSKKDALDDFNYIGPYEKYKIISIEKL
jgi:hypothetical protein